MMTSFVRIVVVLSLLRTALGLQQSPPNSVIVSLALFLTLFVMTPTLKDAYAPGHPAADRTIRSPPSRRFDRAAVPMKKFMLGPCARGRSETVHDMAGIKTPTTPEAGRAHHPRAGLHAVSELKRAFEIGFLIFVPFLIIDMAVASILMSMGMMMLPPVIISLPFKLIFFVLVDGWRLISGSLVESYLHSPPPT